VHTLPRPLGVVVAIVVATLLFAGCTGSTSSPVATTTPSSVAMGPLVTVETRGGECPEGPCGSLIKIGQDGSVHQVLPTDQDLGMIPKGELDALAAEIERANFSLIESRPFTGECPTAFDGQETIYTFHLPTGDEEIATCKVAIDPNHPLFLAAGAAMRTFTSEGRLP
jgi:hypothetical protein